jgi:hypothetical protein
MTVNNSFPSTITLSSPSSFIQNGLATVNLTVSGVTLGTPNANVYWSDTTTFNSGNLIGSYAFNGSSLIFPFRPGTISQVYFFIKGVAIDTTEQSTPIRTSSSASVGNTTYPISITSVSPMTIIKDVSTTITLTIAGVISTMRAYVYWNTSNNFGTATPFTNPISFSNNTLTVSITPITVGNLYFFVKGFDNVGTLQGTEISTMIDIKEFPTSISNILIEPALSQYETSSITLTIANVNNGEPSANVYWGTTNSFGSATLIQKVNFTSSNLTFSFTPLYNGFVFFFVKAISTGNIPQPTALISSVQNISVPTVKTIYKLTEDYTSSGILNNDALASSIIVCYPGNTLQELSRSLNGSESTKTVTRALLKTDESFLYGVCTRVNTAIDSNLFFSTFSTNIFANNFTIEGWFKSSNIDYNEGGDNRLFYTRPDIYSNSANNSIMLYMEWTGGTQYMYKGGWRYVQSAPVRLLLRQSGGVEDNNVYGSWISSISYNNFFHLAFTFELSTKTYKIYLNGVLYLTSIWSTKTIHPGTELGIGSFYFINDLRVYKTIKYTSNFNVSQIINYTEYPSNISSISSFPPLVKNGTSTVFISLVGAINGNRAKVYYSTVSNANPPTSIGTYTIVGTTISFPFSPTTVSANYFYVKGILNGQDQGSYIVSANNPIADPYPTSILSVGGSLIQGVNTTITITLANVTIGASSAYVGYHSTSNANPPTLISGATINFVDNTLSFSFTPISSSSVYFYVAAVSNGVSATYLVSSAIAVTSPYSTTISNIGYSTTYLKVGITSTITITLVSVNTTYTPKANIYYSSSNADSNPTKITAVSPVNYSVNDLSFNFSPSNSGSIYFYVRSISSGNLEQLSYVLYANESFVLDIPSVSFTTGAARGGNSSVASSPPDVYAWSQTGNTLEPSIVMLPSYLGNTPDSSWSSSGVTVVDNVFNGHQGILTTSNSGNNYCLSTESSITFGGGASVSAMTYSIYLLCRPVNNSSQAAYICGYGMNVNGQGNVTNVLSQFGRTSGGNIFTNTQNNSGNTLFSPGFGTYAYPNLTNGFEIWTFTKSAGYPSPEVYRNNTTPITDHITQRSDTSVPPFQQDSFWRIGSGSGYSASGSSYIGAFRIYKNYHNNLMRAAVKAEMEADFGTTAT